MNVNKFTVDVVQAGSYPGIRINGYPPGTDGGIYVVIPIDWPSYAALEPVAATQSLAADLANALETMAYMYDYPEEAEELQMFDDPQDVVRIRRLRAMHATVDADQPES